MAWYNCERHCGGCFGGIDFHWVLLVSTGFTFFHFFRAINNCGRSQSCQLSSPLTRSAFTPFNFSRTLLAMPCTLKFSKGFQWLHIVEEHAGCVSLTVGISMIFWMEALTISLVLPYSLLRMFLALSYPSVVKGNPSISARTLGSTSSFRYTRHWIYIRQVNFGFVLVPERQPICITRVEFRNG